MTEAEWLTCEDPQTMLASLPVRGSERKYRLFAVACSRRVLHLMRDDRSWAALDIAEQFADGKVSTKSLIAARGQAGIAAHQASNDPWAYEAEIEFGVDAHYYALCALSQGAGAALQCVAERARTPWTPEASRSMSYQCAIGAISSQMMSDSIRENGATDESFETAMVRGDSAGKAESSRQAELLRDVFGIPFRPKQIDSGWLAWHDGTACKIAQAIYDERAFDRLPILADALEDAGCDDADILRHCREPGEHVRGCWVIDLLLGKE